MKLDIQVASTSQTVNVFIQDSSSTVGAGLTGLVFNSAGLTAYYALPKAAAVAITLATLAAVTSAYSSGGFKEIDATNMPGWYRLDIPDAALASGRFVSIHLKGATNMAPLPIEIELTAWNNQDATAGGLSRLDAAVTSRLAPTVAARTLDVSAGGAVTLASPPGIRKNVALAKFEFLMTDSTNHNPVTGKTVSVTRSIDGGAFAAGTLSAVTEISNGIYSVDFGSGDLNGNIITLRATATASDDLFITIATSP